MGSRGPMGHLQLSSETSIWQLSRGPGGTGGKGTGRVFRRFEFGSISRRRAGAAAKTCLSQRLTSQNRATALRNRTHRAPRLAAIPPAPPGPIAVWGGNLLARKDVADGSDPCCCPRAQNNRFHCNH